MSHGRTMPVLRKAMEDGSEIFEEELYQYRRYRWLSHEAENLDLRYRRFDLHALVDTVVNIVGGGARSCTKVLKCVEGQFNKAFLLTMDNGIEVLAKIPNPNVGSTFYTTASEVATRNFVQEVLEFPVPRILAYCLDPLNPIGVEYIIEEKACGVSLGSLWRHWSRDSQHQLVTQLVDLEAKLASLSFQCHGCLYYKEDLKAKDVRGQDLQASYNFNGTALKALDSSYLANFVLGPLNRAVLWQNKRATIAMERGPCELKMSKLESLATNFEGENVVDYMKALGMNEIQWTKTYAVPRMNYCRPVYTLESPGEYISLLERYLTIIPHLAAIFPTELHAKTLSLHDLHLDNIFVDPETNKITNIIDWQSTAVSEILFQHKTPAMLPHAASGNPNGETSSIEEHDLLSHYQACTEIKNPLRAVAQHYQHKSVLQAVSLISGAWERNDVFSFRHALISIVAQWTDIIPNSIACPISFSDQELWLHNEEMELLEELGTVLHLLEDQNLISVGGRVLRDDYDRAHAVNARVKEMFVEMAEDEKHKRLYERIWPY